MAGSCRDRQGSEYPRSPYQSPGQADSKIPSVAGRVSVPNPSIQLLRAVPEPKDTYMKRFRSQYPSIAPWVIALVVLAMGSACSPSPADQARWTAGAAHAATSGPEGDAVMPPDPVPPPSNLPLSPIDDGAEATEDQLRPPPRDDPRMPADPEFPPETSPFPLDRLPPPRDPGTMLQRYTRAAEPPVGHDRAERIPSELYTLARRDGRVRVLVELAVAEASAADLRRLATPRQALAEVQDRLEADLSALHSSAAREVRRFRVTPGVSMTVDEAGLRFLSGLTYVVSVALNFPLFPHLDASTEHVNVPGALAVGLSGAGQAVAILDTGVETNHPFLGGRVVAEACFSDNQCPGATPGPQVGPGTGAPCTTNGRCDHGTHVAGIAAGLNNAISGVARGADIIAINVFSQEDNANICAPLQAPCILAWPNDIIDGLDQVLLFNNNNNVNVAAANLSLGGGVENQGFCNNLIPLMTAAINNLRAVDVATVISSGNNGFNNGVSFPACIENATTVGSVQNDDSVSGFSNSGPQIDLMAPGANIESSDLNGGFEVKSGTSMAAPHVAGAFAVMRQRFPNEPVAAIEQRLENEGVQVTDPGANLTRPRLRLPFGWMWESGNGSGSIGLWNQDQTNDRYVVGDFDGDGRDDLLSIKAPWVHLHSYTGSGWHFLWGTNSGSIHWWNLSSSDRYVVGDFDGDGQDELLAIKDPWAHLMKYTGGGWQYIWGTGSGWIGSWNMDVSDKFLAGDLDGDGRAELLSVKDPWHHVHRFNGTGWTWVGGSNSGWIGSWNIGSADRYAIADVDGDGREEFLSFKDPWHHVDRFSGGGWQWVSGSGNGFIDLWNMGSGDSYVPIDIDGSGASELFCVKNPWAHLMRHSGSWNWFWGTGQGRFALWNMSATDRHHAGDFDGDGVEELLSIKDPWHHVSRWRP